jgi:hypothetical protein
MKLFDRLIKSIIVVIFVLFLFALNQMQEMKSLLTRFYEYDGKKINLTQVKVIEPRVDYIISYDDASDLDTFYRHSEQINEKEIDTLEKVLKEAQKSDYYEIRLLVYLLFDDQKIILYKSPLYFKTVHKYSVNANMLHVLKNYGIDDFQYKGIASLQGEIYTDKEKFVDDVVRLGKLKKSAWSQKNIPLLGMGKKAAVFMRHAESYEHENLLQDKDIQAIIKALRDAYQTYMSIQ